MDKRQLFLLALIVAFFATLIDIRAQTAGATFRPALIESASIAYSYSGKSGYKNSAPHGETAVHNFEASAGARTKLAETILFSYGVAFALNNIDSDDALPVPEQLGEASINLGLTKIFSEKWIGTLAARPGYYGDLGRSTSRTLNSPLIAMARYMPNAKYTWVFGISLNPFADDILVPVLTFRWNIDEKWTLNLGFPRLGLIWQTTEKIELSLFGSVQGGNYRTTENPNNTPRADLANTYVNYREIRIGARAAWQVAAKTTLSAELGWMPERRFDYHDRNYKLKGKSAAYMTLSLDIKM